MLYQLSYLAAARRVARRLGMRTALVLTGKIPPDGVDAAIDRSRFRPDGIAPSVAEVIAAGEVRTYDMGGTATTLDLGRAVAARVPVGAAR